MNNNIKFQANAAKKWVECARFHCYNWEVKWYISYSEKLYKEGDKKKKVYSFIFFLIQSEKMFKDSIIFVYSFNVLYSTQIFALSYLCQGVAAFHLPCQGPQNS